MEKLKEFLSTWKHEILAISLVLVVALGANLAIWWYNYRDSRFDKAAEKSQESIERHEQNANELEPIIQSHRVDAERARQRRGSARSRVSEIERKKTDEENKLKDDLRAINDSNLNPVERCKRGCENARRLGLIQPDEVCDCK